MRVPKELEFRRCHLKLVTDLEEHLALMLVFLVFAAVRVVAVDGSTFDVDVDADAHHYHRELMETRYDTFLADICRILGRLKVLQVHI